MEKMSDVQETYTRYLAARHSPSNGCHEPDGTALTVVPRESVPLKDYVAHAFVRQSDLCGRSKYGWVEQGEPFALETFLSHYPEGVAITPDMRDHAHALLRAVAKLNPGTPVAVDYASRGEFQKRMVLWVHRIILRGAAP